MIPRKGDILPRGLSSQVPDNRPNENNPRREDQSRKIWGRQGWAHRPSGCARPTRSQYLPPAPGRAITCNDLPSALSNSAAMSRATVSALPPAARPCTRSIDRVGQVWAAACEPPPPLRPGRFATSYFGYKLFPRMVDAPKCLPKVRCGAACHN